MGAGDAFLRIQNLFNFVLFVFFCIYILLHLYLGNLYFVLLDFVVFVSWYICNLSGYQLAELMIS